MQLHQPQTKPHTAALPRTNFALAAFWALLLFATALAVRLPWLGGFLTIDEVKWMEGAGQFLLALNSGNLAQTYWHFFPGITITWLEALIEVIAP